MNIDSIRSALMAVGASLAFAACMIDLIYNSGDRNGQIMCLTRMLVFLVLVVVCKKLFR